MNLSDVQLPDPHTTLDRLQRLGDLWARAPLDRPDALALGRQLSDVLDDWLVACWRAIATPALRRRATLAATGGYGRRELSFGSDLDVCVEIHDPALLDQPETAHAIESWLTHARLVRVPIAHAVRTPEQAAEAMALDWRTPLVLLDLRVLEGEPPRVGPEQAIALLRGEDEGRATARALLERHVASRSRTNQTAYLLEPDIKQGVGALRDLHMLRWAARIVPHAHLDQAQIARALVWLTSIRHTLHLHHGRRHDRLRYPDQAIVAQALSGNEDDPRVDGIESFMRLHYTVTRRLQRLFERSMRRWSEQSGSAITPIDARLAERDGELIAREEDGQAIADLDAVMEVIEVADRHHSWLLGGALEEHLSQMVADSHDASLAPDHEARLLRRLVALITHPGANPRTSTRLVEIGLMERLMPEFSPIVCHVQHDTYHTYTTDVHTLYALERARALCHGAPDEAGERWPHFATLARALDRPDALLWSALMHDVGKNRGGDHSVIGARIVAEIGQRAGMDEDFTTTCARLVEHHLLLSNTSRRRDLSDPATIIEVARAIEEDPETLRLLTALTFCDMSTVSPASMNDWRASLLWQLHAQVAARLAANAPPGEATQRNELLNSISHLDLDPALIKAFLEDLPDSFSHGDQGRLIAPLFEAWHEAITHPGTTHCRVHQSGQVDGIAEVIVVAPDVHGALARMAGVIAANGANILSAEIASSERHELAIDVFRVAGGGLDANAASLPPLHQRQRDGITAGMIEVLDRGADVRQMLRRRIDERRLEPRATPPTEIDVREIAEPSGRYTLIEIRAPDRLGLLYEIATTLAEHGVEVRLSKIDRLGHKIVDAFYLERPRGGRLEPSHVEAITDALRRTILHSPSLDHPHTPS